MTVVTASTVPVAVTLVVMSVRDTFNGTVRQVRQKATTTNNVVTYEVVISAPNGDLKLKPGLTANVTIYTLERNDVLGSAALRMAMYLACIICCTLAL